MHFGLPFLAGLFISTFFRSSLCTCETPRGWHLDRIDQSSGLDSCFNGNVTARTKPVLYVIDSGVYDKHEEFTSKGVNVIHGYNFLDNSWDSSDCSGHGTHVAALAAGRTFGVAGSIPVDVVSIRMLDCQGRGTCSAMIKAMEWVYQNHTLSRPSQPGVVVMSVGSNQDECKSADIAAEALLSANILVVAAAGNSGIDACKVHPASSPNTVTVSAILLEDSTNTDRTWSKSNYGTCVDIHAPGVDIPSAGTKSPSSQKVLSGTSMAAPQVAGQSLLIMASLPELDVMAVRDVILSSATKGTLSSEDIKRSPKANVALVPYQRMRETSMTSRAGGDSFDEENKESHQDSSFAGDIVVFDVKAPSRSNPPMQYVATRVSNGLTSVFNDSDTTLSTECRRIANAIDTESTLLMRCVVRTVAGMGDDVAKTAGSKVNLVREPGGSDLVLYSEPEVVQKGSEAGKSGFPWIPLIAGCAVGAVLIVALAGLLWRRFTR